MSEAIEKVLGQLAGVLIEEAMEFCLSVCIRCTETLLDTCVVESDEIWGKARHE